MFGGALLVYRAISIVLIRRAGLRVGRGARTGVVTSPGYRAPAPEVFVPTFAGVDGCATPGNSAGHATAGAKTDHALALRSDHLMGADHHEEQPA